MVRLRKEQMLVDGKERLQLLFIGLRVVTTAAALAFLILKRSMVMHASHYDGVLAQVTRVLGDGAPFSMAKCRLYHQNMGCCYATII